MLENLRKRSLIKSKIAAGTIYFLLGCLCPIIRTADARNLPEPLGCGLLTLPSELGRTCDYINTEMLHARLLPTHNFGKKTAAFGLSLDGMAEIRASLKGLDATGKWVEVPSVYRFSMKKVTFTPRRYTDSALIDIACTEDECIEIISDENVFSARSIRVYMKSSHLAQAMKSFSFLNLYFCPSKSSC